VKFLQYPENFPKLVQYLPDYFACTESLLGEILVNRNRSTHLFEFLGKLSKVLKPGYKVVVIERVSCGNRRQNKENTSDFHHWQMQSNMMNFLFLSSH